MLAYAVDGDGGKIETSGSTLDTSGITVNAGSKNGKGGLWLLDPYDYNIGKTQAASISTVLDTGTSVTILTSSNTTKYGSQGDANGDGDITVNSSISTSGIIRIFERSIRRVPSNVSIFVLGYSSKIIKYF